MLQRIRPLSSLIKQRMSQIISPLSFVVHNQRTKTHNGKFGSKSLIVTRLVHSLQSVKVSVEHGLLIMDGGSSIFFLTCCSSIHT